MNKSPHTPDGDAALWRRIQSLDIGPAGAAIPFERRLARENGWTAGHARRVVAEYRRFLFLAARAGHPVSPSEDVDQAWHLHLAYTESYWNVLCRDVLGFPFHHGPATGAPGERGRFVDWYERTRASYRRLFGEDAPADIWPASDQRFEDAVAHQRVDRRRFWLVPKPDPRRWLAAVAAVVAVAASAGCGSMALVDGFNVFDWRGPEFLVFFLALSTVLFLFVALLRRRPAGDDGSEVREDAVDPVEAGALADGDSGAIRAALVALAQRECVQPGVGKASVVRLGGDAAGLGWFEGDVLKAVPEFGTSIPAIRHRVRPSLTLLRDTLVQKGWLVSPSQVASRRLAALLAVLAVVAIGIAKVAIGISRGRPVIFLVVLVALVAGFGVWHAWRMPRRTRVGEALLVRLRRRFQGASLTGPMGEFDPLWLAPVMVGLFGSTVLAGSEWSAWQAPLAPPRPIVQAGGSGGSGSSGGCGSDSGGGGCGGGGCGGCGGGGD